MNTVYILLDGKLHVRLETNIQKKTDPNQHAHFRHIPSKDQMMQTRAKFAETFTDRDRQTEKQCDLIMQST